MQKELNKQVRLEEQSQKDQKKQAITAKKRKPEDAALVESKKPKTSVARSGRIIALPIRFKE
jgi:hypothetical protein